MPSAKTWSPPLFFFFLIVAPSSSSSLLLLLFVVLSLLFLRFFFAVPDDDDGVSVRFFLQAVHEHVHTSVSTVFVLSLLLLFVVVVVLSLLFFRFFRFFFAFDDDDDDGVVLLLLLHVSTVLFGAVDDGCTTVLTTVPGGMFAAVVGAIEAGFDAAFVLPGEVAGAGAVTSSPPPQSITPGGTPGGTGRAAVELPIAVPGSGRKSGGLGRAGAGGSTSSITLVLMR